jgi:hypothetical protein
MRTTAGSLPQPGDLELSGNMHYELPRPSVLISALQHDDTVRTLQFDDASVASVFICTGARGQHRDREPIDAGGWMTRLWRPL